MLNSAEKNIFLLINMKMPIIVVERFHAQLCLARKNLQLFVISKFISRTYFMLSWVEHKISFIDSEPDLRSIIFDSMKEFGQKTWANSIDPDDAPKHCMPIIQHFSNISITKTRLFKYTEHFNHQKNEKFQIRIRIFLILLVKIQIVGTCLNRLGEAGLTSTHNLCFWAEIRKIMYIPVNPSFTI